MTEARNPGPSLAPSDRQMDEVIITLRLPPESRARLRAVCAVTGLSLQHVVTSAFEKFYRTLPTGVRLETARVVKTRKRYGNGGQG
jgi:hypothetical protein